MDSSRVQVKVTRGVYTIAALALAFFISSRTTGAGWLTVLLATALGLLAVGVIGPLRAVRKVTATASGPTDAVAGRPFDVVLGLGGPAQFLRVRTVNPLSEWSGAGLPTSGKVRAVADRRGVISRVAVEVATASPVGLAWATRQLTITLPAPIAVAPRVEPVPSSAVTSLPATGSEATGKRTGGGETVRSIRDYQEGDSLRMIHWPATARMNNPVVKELESPDAPHLVVRLDLNCSPAEADRRASLAFGHVQRGLLAGVPVRLLTAESTGPHAGAVGSMLEAGRRLAYATAGQPAEPPADPHPVTIVAVP